MKSPFRKAQTILYVSIIVNIVLTVVKWVVGELTGSIALLADSIHSFTDIFATIAVLFGLWLMKRKPSEHFPYGFYKAENLATLVVSILILWSGFEIIFESLNTIFSPHGLLRFDLAFSVSLGSAIISYIMAHYKEKIGYEANSEALISEGKHSKIDSIATFAVFIGIAFSFIGFSLVEPLVALVIAVYVIYLGLSFGKDATLSLMDACPNIEYLEQMKDIATKVNGVIKVKDAKLRKAGPFLFGELEIAVDERITTKKAHEIGDEVEEKIKRALTNLEHLIIHVEPVRRTETRKVAVPLESNEGEQSRISEHFGQAPYFGIVTLHNDRIEKLKIVKNPNVKLSKKRGIETAKFLLKHNISDLITKNIGEGPYHTLKDNLVEIYNGKDLETLKEAIDLIRTGKLSLLKEPTE